MVKDTIPQLAQLTVEQKLALIDELWDEVAASDQPVPEWHQRELERAEAEYLAADDAAPAEEVIGRLRRQFPE